MEENIIRTDYDLQQGDRYRQGDSTPTDPKWIAYDEQLKARKREEKAKAKTATVVLIILDGYIIIIMV